MPAVPGVPKAPVVPKPALRPKLIQVKYRPHPQKEKISLTITGKDREIFLKNLSI